MKMKDRLGNTLEVGDKALANDPESDKEFLVTLEVIKSDRSGKPYAECTNEYYEVFCFVAEDLELVLN